MIASRLPCERQRGCLCGSLVVIRSFLIATAARCATMVPSSSGSARFVVCVPLRCVTSHPDCPQSLGVLKNKYVCVFCHGVVTSRLLASLVSLTSTVIYHVASCFIDDVFHEHCIRAVYSFFVAATYQVFAFSISVFELSISCPPPAPSPTTCLTGKGGCAPPTAVAHAVEFFALTSTLRDLLLKSLVRV